MNKREIKTNKKEKKLTSPWKRRRVDDKREGRKRRSHFLSSTPPLKEKQVEKTHIIRSMRENKDLNED
jgi:hypothetical protein